MTLKFILVAVALITGSIPTDNWKSDASKAQISFTIKGPLGKVNGKFSGLKTEIKFDENDLPGSSFTASIEAKTVSTGIGLRNRDLRKKKIWLDTNKYPSITFKSKKIEKEGSGYKATGELTLKGISKPTEIPFTFSSEGETGIFKGQFTINREDFKVGKSGGSVGKIVTIMLEVPVKKNIP